MITYDYLGTPLTSQKIVPGNTATGLSESVLTYTEYTLAYTGGGATEIVAGDWIVGATSAAKAEVISLTLTSGTWGAGTAAGTLRLKNVQGTFQSENIKVRAGTDDATITGAPTAATDTYANKARPACAALVTCSGQTALFNIDGGKPDQTALIGHDIPANGSYVLTDPTAIRNFKVIDKVSGSASTVNVTLYFAPLGAVRLTVPGM